MPVEARVITRYSSKNSSPKYLRRERHREDKAYKSYWMLTVRVEESEPSACRNLERETLQTQLMGFQGGRGAKHRNHSSLEVSRKNCTSHSKARGC